MDKNIDVLIAGQTHSIAPDGTYIRVDGAAGEVIVMKPDGSVKRLVRLPSGKIVKIKEMK